MKSQQHIRLNWHRLLNLTVVSVMVISLLTSPFPVLAVDVPTPLTPTDGLVTTVDNHPPLGIPEFSWTPVEGATLYKIQFSSNIAFTENIRDFTTPLTSFTPKDITQFEDRIWYWHVMVDAPSDSVFSPTMQFTKQWAAQPTNLF